MSPERFTPPQEPETTLAGRSLDDWHRTLTGDNLAVPCSRYGRDADSCAWWAVALLALYEAGGAAPEDAEAISDFAMGLVVNDNADVALMLSEHWSDVPKELQEQLGGKEAVEELRDE